MEIMDIYPAHMQAEHWQICAQYWRSAPDHRDPAVCLERAHRCELRAAQLAFGPVLPRFLRGYEPPWMASDCFGETFSRVPHFDME